MMIMMICYSYHQGKPKGPNMSQHVPKCPKNSPEKARTLRGPPKWAVELQVDCPLGEKKPPFNAKKSFPPDVLSPVAFVRDGD